MDAEARRAQVALEASKEHVWLLLNAHELDHLLHEERDGIALKKASGCELSGEGWVRGGGTGGGFSQCGVSRATTEALALGRTLSCDARRSKALNSITSKVYAL